MAFWIEALGYGEGPRARNFVLEFGLSNTLNPLLHADGLNLLEVFLSPSTPCASLAGEPGWAIYRKPEPGEPRSRALAWNANNHAHGALPVPPIDAGASASWPSGTRFFAEAQDLNDMGDPAHPEVYHTAAEFHHYIRHLMPSYARHHPEHRAQCERIVALSQAWVDRDA